MRPVIPALLLAALAAATPSRRSPMPAPTIKRLTPVLFVDRIAPMLPFWVERLGFQSVAEVPGPDGQPQFVILVKDGIEVMYQTWPALEAEHPELANGMRGHSTTLFIEVDQLDAVDRALAGIPRAVERHRTFYGMEELTVKEPGGALVTFAMPVPAE